jgi:hypothetical protein
MKNIQKLLKISESLVSLNSNCGSLLAFFHPYSTGNYPSEIRNSIIQAQRIIDGEKFNFDELLNIRMAIEKQFLDAQRLKERETKEREAKEREAKALEKRRTEAAEQEAKERLADKKDTRNHLLIGLILAIVMICKCIPLILKNQKEEEQREQKHKEEENLQALNKQKGKKKISAWLNGSTEPDMLLEGYGGIEIVHWGPNTVAFWKYDGAGGVDVFSTSFDNPKKISYTNHERHSFFKYDDYEDQTELYRSIWFLPKFKEWALKFISLNDDAKPEKFTKQILPPNNLFEDRYRRTRDEDLKFFFIFQKDIGPALLVSNLRWFNEQGIKFEESQYRFKKEDFTRFGDTIYHSQNFYLYRIEELYLAESFVKNFTRTATSMRINELKAIQDSNTKQRAQQNAIEKKFQVQ